ncbi:electron transfer flavoprotein subunit beta/FixA family protein, partial [Streptomyces sp. NPDC057621]|uniref:electron transfer flavoprotein subunit beta/FixA family protein n=1 Tax=Streptomyces sp. NPDC057621 TaxID=3346186 RepID=UPI0036A551FC
MTLRIVVLVKYVPDASGDRGFAPDTTADRASTDGLLCELDEYAVEQALQIAEGDSEARVTVVTVGPEEAAVALHKALAMGADDAVHITDEAIHGSDALAHALTTGELPEVARPFTPGRFDAAALTE